MRVVERVEQSDGCWEWTGKVASNGFGRIGDRWAHRVAYLEEVGPVADGVEVRHLCLNAQCVRPDHLELHRRGAARKSYDTESSEYRSWQHMITRCEDPANKHFSNYGGRGIRVCVEWRVSFETFLRDLGPKPTSLHTLDRVDSDGNYEPGNCRWATRREQQRNRRVNVRLTLDGVTRCAEEWAEISGVQAKAIVWRFRHGWPVRDAIYTAPSLKSRSRRAA